VENWKKKNSKLFEKNRKWGKNSPLEGGAREKICF
jgi:hypothetical protein